MNSSEDRRTATTDLLAENAYLRERLSGYEDSAFVVLLYAWWWSLEEENDYLRELLAWESARIVKVGELLPVTFGLVDENLASDDEISESLAALVKLLKKSKHELIYTDHLSDRALYKLVVRRLLPMLVKRLEQNSTVCYWDFSSFDEENNLIQVDDDSVWVACYADDLERWEWSQAHGIPAPPRRAPVTRRDDRVAQRELNFH